MQERIVHSLYQRILADSNLTQRQKRQLLDDARQLLPDAHQHRATSWVIWLLALVVLSIPLTCAAHVLLVGSFPNDIPDGLLSLASAAGGALAGYLTPRQHRREAEPREEDEAWSAAERRSAD